MAESTKKPVTDGVQWSGAGSLASVVRPVLGVCALVAALLLHVPVCSAQCGPEWIGSTGTTGGTSERIYAMAMMSNGDVIAGGQFDTAGGVTVNNIARWNGVKWSELGGGVSGGPFVAVLAAVTMPNGDLVIAGEFLNAGAATVHNIARWNGTSWSPLGSGFSVGYPTSLAVLPNGDLIAAGTFNNAGGVAANNIARWNGTSWSALGSGLDAGGHALAVLPNGDLVVGGNFGFAGGVSANCVARWNGIAWSAMGTGMAYPTWTPSVSALGVLPNGDVVAGGIFATAGGVTVNNIARWNGSAWSALGAGTTPTPFGSVVAMTVLASGDVIAGGQFDTAGGAPAARIARWNGSAWSTLGVGVDNIPRAMVAVPGSSGAFYVGGDMTSAGGFPVQYIAKWQGSAWTTGMNNQVNALKVIPSGDLVAGGTFTTAGGVSAFRVGKWNGAVWSDMELGVTGAVNALAVAVGTGDLFAGGAFNAAGSVGAPKIARWHSPSWFAVGSGLNNTVNALAAMPNGDIVAGGVFNLTAGGPPVTVNQLARWNGTAWSALGSGTNASLVSLVAMPNGDLIAGGNFSLINGVAANGIARWNGSVWSPLGTGIPSGVVQAMIVMPNGDLVAGGIFATAGGVTVNNIARWNGAAWSAMGVGVNSRVNALALRANGDLVVGGDFTSAGGLVANRVALWDGASWAVFGTGVNGTVWALAVLPNGELAAGGAFTTAGGLPSPYFARFTFGAPAPSISSQPPAIARCPAATASFTVVASGSGLRYRWRKGGVPIDVLANPSAATATLTLSNVQIATAGSYDCLVTGTCGSVTSNMTQLFVDPADLGRQGGIAGRDGLHDNNDFVVFIDIFFNHQPAADIGKQGGILGSDGQWDNNDFVVFIDQFFTAC